MSFSTNAFCVWLLLLCARKPIQLKHFPLFIKLFIVFIGKLMQIFSFTTNKNENRMSHFRRRNNTISIGIANLCPSAVKYPIKNLFEIEQMWRIFQSFFVKLNVISQFHYWQMTRFLYHYQF